MTTMIDGDAGALAVHHLAGDQDNPNVLLVCHANGFPGRCYRAFANELADVVRTVALDFRGHGDSATPPLDEFGWAGMSDDVRRTIDWLLAQEVDHIHAFGHSLGGAALIDAERRRPGMVASAFAFEPVIAPNAAFGQGDGSPLIQSAKTRTRQFASRAAALARYAARPPLGLFRADVLHDYVMHGFAEQPDGSVVLKCTPESEVATYRNAAGDIILEQMPEVTRPVCIGKSGDGQFPAQLADAIVAQAPGASLLEFPSITHFGPLQDPIVVAAAMRSIIADA